MNAVESWLGMTCAVSKKYLRRMSHHVTTIYFERIPSISTLKPPVINHCDISWLPTVRYFKSLANFYGLVSFNYTLHVRLELVLK